MEYNNEETIKHIHDLLFLLESDVATLKSNRLNEGVRLGSKHRETGSILSDLRADGRLHRARQGPHW